MLDEQVFEEAFDEETNLVDVESDDFFGLDDTEVEAEEVEEVEEETEVEEVAEETTEAESTEEVKPFLMLKYNHADLPIGSEDEAKALAQLGYHYQNKIQPEYEGLKVTAEKVTGIQQIADLYGMDIDTLTKSLYDQYLEQTAASQEVPVEIVRREMELTKKEKAEADRVAKEQSTKSETTALNDMYQRFWNEYPDADANSIKPETWDSVAKGTDLVTAYTKQLYVETQSKLKQHEQQIKNKNKAPVKSITERGSKEPVKEDDFFLGFDS